MTDLARYAGSAWGGETENGALRWDRNLPTRGTVARERAAVAATDLGEMVAGIEARLSGYPARDAANVRDSWAPLYYDFHRATRVATATDEDVDQLVEEHIASARLAKFIATTRPPTLNPTAADLAVRDGTSDDDFAREYLLFTHSVVPQPLMAWPDPAPYELLERHIVLRDWTLEALQRLDRALRTTFGNLTRSPRFALVAGGTASPYALLRGLVVRGSGDVVVAEIGDPVADEREATYLFAMSLGMRHLRDVQRGFDAAVRARGAGNRDKSLTVSAPGLLAGEHLATSPIDGRVGHFPTEFGRAATAGHGFPARPSQESADHARSLIR